MIQAKTQRPAISRILVSGFVLAALTVTSLMVAKPAHAADFCRPVTRATRSLAITTGTALVLFGVLVLIQPGPIVAQWPWSISPLMVRIFASWFSAFGVGLLWFWVERDWERARYIADLMIAAAGLDLLMVFVHRQDLTSVGPSLWLIASI